MKRITAALFGVAGLFGIIVCAIAAPANAAIADLANPTWREVPGTARPSSSRDSSLFVDSRNLQRQGAIATVDLIQTDASYERVEANCATQELRGTRKGYFVSSNRINYQTISGTWFKAKESDDKALVRFVCGQR